MHVEQTTSAVADLAWLADDFVDRVAQVRKAIVLSSDGLMMAASSGVGREDAEHLSAVAASMFGLARGAGRHLGRGRVRQAVIETDSGFLFVTAAGNGACLAVVASREADAGMVAYEMAMLVVRVGQFLTAPVRSSGA